MSNIAIVEFSKDGSSDLQKMTLEELWNEAATFGAVDIDSTSHEPHPCRCSCRVRFETSPGSLVWAQSGSGSLERYTIEEALIRAIKNARDIAKTMKNFD